MDAMGLLALGESTLRLTIPLLCACLAGLWSERSGVIDIGLEGKLLIAAFAAAAASYATGSAYWGLLAGIGASTLFALVHGFASISQRGNQIVSGVAINMLAAGLTAVIGNAWYGQGGRTPPLEGDQRFLALFDVSDQSRIVQVLFGQSFLVYLALLLVPLTWYVLAKTRFGLRLRAVGEKPAAVDTAGISVTGLRYSAVIIAGVFCGIGGAFIGTALSAGFLPGMTAGKGFIALAALIFAKWRAWPALGACLLFGFLEALSIRLQGVDIPGLGEMPVQAIQALPYAMTVILLAGFVGRAIPPRAAGQPYVKER
ncbi:ABC transporter permease [Salinarimonas chemoclinalis]|uniref:ABC transporter permease n=1 Tax=Salinarimonas chemoclinalis TaxID=3241599 RepID=UPI0035584B7B